MANDNGKTENRTISVDDLFQKAAELENAYRAVLAAKEQNRTMLRSLAAQGFVDRSEVDKFYPPTKRGRKAKDQAVA
jgi:hypothetical protein